MTRVKFCGITRARGRRARGRARRVGARLDPVAGLAARAATPPSRRGIAATLRRRGRARRRVRQPHARRGRPRWPRARAVAVQLHGDEGPAFCPRSRRRTGAEGHQGRPRSARGADVQARRAVPHRLPPARRPRAGCAAAPGETLDWALAARGADVAADPRRGGLTPENVAEAIAATRPSRSTSPAAPSPSPASRTPRSCARSSPRSTGRARRGAERRAMTAASSTASAPTAASTSPRR